MPTEPRRKRACPTVRHAASQTGSSRSDRPIMRAARWSIVSVILPPWDRAGDRSGCARSSCAGPGCCAICSFPSLPARLPREDFLHGDGLELLALAFLPKEIIERGELGGRTDDFLLSDRTLLPGHVGLLHFSNSRFLQGGTLGVLPRSSHFTASAVLKFASTWDWTVSDEPQTIGIGFPEAPHQFRTRNGWDETQQAVGIQQNRRKINEANHSPAAHNGLVPGSSPGGPTNNKKKKEEINVDDKWLRSHLASFRCYPAPASPHDVQRQSMSP